MKKIFLLFLFFIALNSFPQSLNKEDEVLFDQAIKELENKDPYIKTQAIMKLVNLKDLRAVPYIRNLLKDENPYVRIAVLDAMGIFRSKEFVKDIITLLKSEKDNQVRQAAIVTLGYINDPSSVNFILELLKDPKESLNVKYAICNTLSIIRSTQAVDVLIEVLDTTNDNNLKKSVVYALGKIPHNKVVIALRDAVDKNLNNDVVIEEILRVLAVELLDYDSIEKFRLLYSKTSISPKAKFYASYGIAKIAKDNSVLNFIKKSLDTTDEYIKNLAIESLGIIGDKESLLLLKNMLSKESSPYTKNYIINSIQQIEEKLKKDSNVKKTQ